MILGKYYINQEGATVSNKLKNSMILMGIVWSKAAKTKAFKDIIASKSSEESYDEVDRLLTELDILYSTKN